MPAGRMTLFPSWVRSLAPLVGADLRRRYAGSLLGGAWAVLAPVLEAATYGVVFGWVLGASASRGLPYAVLIASGLFPWIAFREAVEGCATLLPDNRWIRRSRVPLDLLVAKLVVTASVRAAIGLLVVLGFALATGRRPGAAGWLLPPVAFVLQAIGTFGVGRLVAPVAALAPDLRPTLVSALTLLTFASPILYPESAARGWLRTVLLCNPFTYLLRLYRTPAEPLAGAGLLGSLAVATSAALAMAALGGWVRERAWWRARDLL